jgi:hypothetical protein
MTSASPASEPPAYDVFNGDADGICALHQLRLAAPKDAILVTGVKRDVALLDKVPCRGGIDVTVLDVSLDANAQALHSLLEAGAQVQYFDHHSAQQAFEHPRFRFFWDDAPEVCTSILVDRHLRGRFREWAVAAAFGDNLPAAARKLGNSIGLGEISLHALEELGLMLNYNAYGESVEDLHVPPCALYRSLHRFADPFEFIEEAPEYRALCGGYLDDAVRMQDLTPCWKSGCGAVYILPAKPWARRISGVFANRLVSPGDTRSYAVLTETARGAYVVSVRSGRPEQRGANGLCAQFPTGGGRKSAAGINSLPGAELDNFIRAFSDYFGDAAFAASPGQPIHSSSSI